MIKFFITLLLAGFFLYGYVDSDLDGVDDSVDKCPNTPFSDLVDESGCTVESLAKKEKSKTSKHSVEKKRIKSKRAPAPVLHESSKTYDTIEENEKKSVTHYDISLGFNKFGGSSSETVMADMYHGDFSLSLFTAVDNERNYDDSRLNDTRVWGYYSYRYSKSLLLKAGAGVIMPHIDGDSDKRVDAGFSLFGSYTVGSLNPYLGASYRFTGLKGDEYGLQNNYSIYGGAGFYLSNKLYMSYTYAYSSAEYNWADDIKTDSLYLYYNIDDNWFGTASYMRNIEGLDYDDGFSLSIGYYF